MRAGLIIFAIMGSILSLCSPALAQVAIICGPLPDIAHQLKTQFGEERIGAGLSSQILTGGESQPTMLFQIFASSKGTWTMVVSNPSGDACPLATGTNWETYPIPTTGTEG
jgi:hypothetical protein